MNTDKCMGMLINSDKYNLIPMNADNFRSMHTNADECKVRWIQMNADRYS